MSLKVHTRWGYGSGSLGYFHNYTFRHKSTRTHSYRRGAGVSAAERRVADFLDDDDKRNRWTDNERLLRWSKFGSAIQSCFFFCAPPFEFTATQYLLACTVAANNWFELSLIRVKCGSGKSLFFTFVDFVAFVEMIAHFSFVQAKFVCFLVRYTMHY